MYLKFNGSRLFEIEREPSCIETDGSVVRASSRGAVVEIVTMPDARQAVNVANALRGCIEHDASVTLDCDLIVDYVNAVELDGQRSYAAKWN